MESVLLFSFKTDRIKVTVEAFFDDKDNLVIEGYDIGKAVEEHWGDSDYEYSSTVSPEEVKKLYIVVNLRPGDRKGLLSYLQTHYHTNTCYSEIRTWFDDNHIRYEGFSWT